VNLLPSNQTGFGETQLASSTGVFSFTIDNGRIVAITVVRNPDKLHDLPSDGVPDWFLGPDTAE